MYITHTKCLGGSGKRCYFLFFGHDPMLALTLLGNLTLTNHQRIYQVYNHALFHTDQLKMRVPEFYSVYRNSS